MKNRVIEIAKSQIGYLEKNSDINLDSKTANAGRNNYTKYWRDIAISYQGQPWCAAFVTWVFFKAFGKSDTKKLLRHYPYVYCPTMAGLFTLNSNPKVGDIVIFKRNNEFVHTGIVIHTDGDYFETVEGNTSDGTTIIDNGGAVCKKSYYNSSLPGTKFITPDWSIVEHTEEYTDNNDIVWELANRKVLTDKDLWLQYCKNDSNVYWFCRKLCQYIRTKKTFECADIIYTDNDDILWDLHFRHIITDVELWRKKMTEDKNIYYLLQKGLHYCRTH